MTKRQWIISIVSSIIIVLIGAGVSQMLSKQKESTISKSSKGESIRTVQLEQFPAKTRNAVISIDGRVTAIEKINVAAEVSGRLSSGIKSYKNGSYFNKGDLLFQIESKDEVLNLKAAKAQLYSAITQAMPDIKFDFPESFNAWKAYLDQFDYDKPLSPLPKAQTVQENYFIGGRSIPNQYFSIKSQEERLKDFNIYAPFSGVFLSVNAFPGSLVTPGVNLGQIMNTSRYEMVSPLSAEEMSLVKTGQKVSLRDESTGQEYIGTISRFSRQIDQTTQSIPMYISVSGKGLRDGMYLKGSINGKEVNGLSKIPKTAIINQNELYVAKDSSIQKIDIEVKSFEGDSALVSGISPNDRIVVSSTNNLYVGQKVNY